MSILITGGTKGNGLAVAHRFANSGRPIFLNYLRDDEAAHAAVAALRAAGATAFAIRGDVGAPDGAKALIDKVSRDTTELRLVVHCAVRVLVGPILTADPVAFAWRRRPRATPAAAISRTMTMSA
jgi:NAD(P)-dependent dehydrogenase (short-subunit alcohol dehydrogenase family)